MVYPLCPKVRAGGAPLAKGGRKTQAVNAHVSGCRRPHTVVTSTWADGTPGPLFLSFELGDIPQKTVKAVNSDPMNEGVVHIYLTKTDSHFMNHDSTHYYFTHLLTPAD